MAHEIDFSTGRPAMVTVGRPAWHGIGRTVNKISPLEALQQAALDYYVGIAPNVHSYPVDPITGLKAFPDVISDESFFTYRADTGGILGDKLGKYYKPLQNSEAIEIVSPLCEMGFKVNVAGALRNGRTMFLTFELGEYSVGNDDKIKTYLVFTNTHDGSRNIYAFFTDVRVVCWNTLTLALSLLQSKAEKGKRKEVVKVRHTGDVKAKTEQAIEWLVMAENHIKAATSTFERLVDTSFTSERFFDYVAAVMMDATERNKLKKGDPAFISTRKRNLIENFLEYAQFGPGQAEYQGTAWGAYNAVTGFLGNVKNYKDHSTRTTSLWFGESAKVAERALVLAYEPEKIEPLHKHAPKNFSLN